MAPRLSKIERKMLEAVIIGKLGGKEVIEDAEIATTIVSCSTRTVRNARSNILRHGTIDAPCDTAGRPTEITENMWLALANLLRDRPCISQQRMAYFLYKQYNLTVSRPTIGRLLKRKGWTKKVAQTIAKERNPDLRDDYIERRSHYKLEQMVFIDESGSDRGIANLVRGYAPKGVTPVQEKRFHKGKRVQILPAYTIDGVIYCEVYEENTDTDMVEAFLDRLLPYCGRYPEPKSVIFMDNASFHFFSQEVKDRIVDAGVIIEYQPPYSPDLNPIEYLFGSVKNHIRAQTWDDEDLIRSDLKSYLLMQLNLMGRKTKVARGHFRKAQIDIEDLA
ncbi:hypothetical protein HJFPF1_08399 [Paramyrothecium foliicola]|nr:hypothetical protein HJFPF1_08399 [Paramyrothecium foliicola]